MDNLDPTGLSRVLRLFWTSGYDYKTCRRAAKESGIQPVAFELFVLRWAAKMTTMSSYQAAGIPISCVKYENLISDPYRQWNGTVMLDSHLAKRIGKTKQIRLKRRPQSGDATSSTGV